MRVDPPYVADGPFHEWMSQSTVYLTGLLGAGHNYTEAFNSSVTRADRENADIGLGILRAVREDVAGGYLMQVELMVVAEVFTDFLSMATHLIDAGYKDAAASLVGAVLEDGLRRMARSRNLTVKSSDGLASLNQKLAQSGAYGPIVQSRVMVWKEVRNHADHGKFAEYTTDDVRDMLNGVAQLLSEHLK